MPEFTVCAKSEVKKTVKRWSATHIISTLDQGDRLFRPPRIPAPNHLQLWFEDEEDVTKWGAPTLDHARIILEWSAALPADARVVVHCWAGACRSTAIGIALWLQHNGVHRLPEAAAWLKSDRPQACPNLLLAAHFDQLLGLQGELVRVCDTIGADSINRWWKLNHPD
jgi:predicted protein tyrosine phosphatase